MIGIIDSGYGGLSVVQELIHQNKELPFVYFGDNARNPYGTKSKTEILSCSREIIDYLIENYQIDELIIACNTICAASLPELTEIYQELHIEAITNYGSSAALMSFNQHVTILATNFTVESNIYKKAIFAYDPEITVQQIAAQDFVQMVETDKIDLNKIKSILKQVDDKSDMLILGCTHFPFLYPYIRKEMATDVQIIDPAVTCVASIEREANSNWKEKSLFITSGMPENFATFCKTQHIAVDLPIKQVIFNK